MELRQLRYFLAVVEHGNFSRAAQVIGRTQQALSKGISALERQLGERLFVRDARHAQLTDAGRLLLEHARTADHTVRRFEERLRELQTGAEGEVRIGTGPSTAGSLVASALRAFRAQWPRIRVRVAGGIAPELLPALLARRLDMVVTLHTLGDEGLDPQVRAEHLAFDSYRVLADARHPLAARAALQPGDLADAAWVFGHRLGAVETLFRDAFLAAGLTPPRHTLETSSLEFLRAMVSDADHLTLLPSRLAHAELATGHWCQLEVPGFAWPRPIMMYSRNNEPLNTPMARLQQALRNAAAA